MGETSKIAWTHATFNPWMGCTKTSPGCAKCYAERENVRYGRHLWGPDAPRQRTSETYWKQPLKWNVTAEKEGQRKRVFCGSWCDVMEAGGFLDEIRKDLYSLICRTLDLDWLLLTKRPENFTSLLFPAWLKRPMPNVWLGTTVEDRARRSRIDVLRDVQAAVRFLSIEPLLEDLGELDLRGIDWVIVGGESDGRLCDVAGIRSIVKQCQAAGVPVFVKQMGSVLVGDHDEFPTAIHDNGDGHRTFRLCDRKGADPAEWPEDLRVREIPGVRRG